jgi:hypothetical protein
MLLRFKKKEMQNIFDLLHGAGKTNHLGNAKSLTTKQFLGVEGEEGITTPTQFVEYARSLRDAEVKQLSYYLNASTTTCVSLSGQLQPLIKVADPTLMLNAMWRVE